MATQLLEDWAEAAGTCFVERPDGPVTYGSVKRSDLEQLVRAAQAQRAAVGIEPTQGIQHEQQIRSEMDAVGGRQPVEGPATGSAGVHIGLVASITALVELDEAGVLVPHGIGGHARTLLKAAAKALQAQAAVGAKVFIHLARSDTWVLHTVVGYYVWPPLSRGGNWRVFVRVKDDDGYLNARALDDIRLTQP